MTITITAFESSPDRGRKWRETCACVRRLRRCDSFRGARSWRRRTWRAIRSGRETGGMALSQSFPFNATLMIWR